MYGPEPECRLDKSFELLDDPINVPVYHKAYACEALGVFFTRHGQNCQQKIEVVLRYYLLG